MVAFEEERLHRDREVQEVRHKITDMVTGNHDMACCCLCTVGAFRAVQLCSSYAAVLCM